MPTDELTCSEVVERLLGEAHVYDDSAGWIFDRAKAEMILHEWREQIRKGE